MKFPVRKPFNMTLKQRKERLAKLKKDTHCTKCGEKGHWAGDRECGQKSEMVGTVAYMDLPTQTPGSSNDHVACVAVEEESYDSHETSG